MEKDSERENEDKLEKVEDKEKLSKSLAQPSTKPKQQSNQNPDISKADFVLLDVDSIDIKIVKVDK